VLKINAKTPKKRVKIPPFFDPTIVSFEDF
jgi:hypothetical protein